jgi:deoxyadenosine/deoxycytidine kinase
VLARTREVGNTPGRVRYRYVVVEGVIGVGKTTLVHQLTKRLGARTVLEEFEENPFLPDFYRDRRAFALSTQLFFLMSRFRQQELLAQGDLFRARTVSDYMFDKDRIFALLTLAPHELGIYERLFEVLAPQVPVPDLCVFLSADPKTVLRRIRRRARSYELNMDPAYIEDLARAYGEFFRGFDRCPLAVIETDEIDFRADSATLDRLVDMIERGQRPMRMPKDAQGRLPGM